MHRPVKMSNHMCTTIFCSLVVFVLPATYAQNLQDWEPLQGGPDATFRGNVSVVSLQDLSLSKGSRPDATALAATARSAEGTLSNLVARDLGAGLQGQIAHTDVMPSGILGWPPKQTALAPSPSANDTQPGANGAKDYVPAPSPDPYQIPGSNADGSSDEDGSGAPYHSITGADGYSTFMPRNNSFNGTAFQLFWADSMRNPQILGARLPRGTYWLLPGADTASTGTDAGANSGTDGGASSGTAAGAESGTDGGADLGTGATAGGAFHLSLDCLGRRLPFVLDFQGSALVLVDGRKGGMAFSGCSRLTVRGVTMTYPPSQFQHTQGVVVDVGAPPVRAVTVQMHEGYPANLWADARMCATYTAGTQVIRVNTSDIVPSYVESIDDSHYLLHTTYDLYNVQPGDLLACHTGVGSHGMYWERCADSLMTDTTFHNPAGHWIAEVGCRNMTYLSNHLAPYPSTLGVQQLLPLMSSIGNGFSVQGARSGPTIAGNTMRGMAGDGVTVAAVPYIITGLIADSATITVACSGTACSGIRQGDTVTAASSASEPLLGSAQVVGVARWGLSGLINDTAAPSNAATTPAQADTLQLALANWPASWVQATPAVLLVAPGAGFQIRRNTIANNRGSGIMLQAQGGLVANNMITSPKYWGIQALPSIEGQDGAFTRDLVISNNTIDAVFGGVFVGCLTAAGQVPCPARGHSNLTIAANLIQNAATMPLLLTSARTVSVVGNVFRSVLCYPWVLYNGYPWLPRFWEAVGFVAEADDVTFRSNIIDTSAHCSYGNTLNPFEALSGTVTNLTIA
ncbi:hypothetical protein WJX75_006524 [Coccomyxa subellipsoidea]|uniref:Right handed beta helix domain-containing protein n=1 Tax=Coccomyxa subellipsoidea TaxID=248742 RepID=A0ABR2Z1N9_9CHLO